MRPVILTEEGEVDRFEAFCYEFEAIVRAAGLHIRERGFVPEPLADEEPPDFITHIIYKVCTSSNRRLTQDDLTLRQWIACEYVIEPNAGSIVGRQTVEHIKAEVKRHAPGPQIEWLVSKECWRPRKFSSDRLENP